MGEIVFFVCFGAVCYGVVKFLKKYESTPEQLARPAVTNYDANMAARIGEETAKALHRMQQADKEPK